MRYGTLVFCFLLATVFIANNSFAEHRHNQPQPRRTQPRNNVYVTPHGIGANIGGISVHVAPPRPVRMSPPRGAFAPPPCPVTPYIPAVPGPRLGDRNYQGGFDSRNAIAYPGKREEERKYVAARERSKRVAVGYYYDERGRRQTIYETYRWVEPAYYNVTVYEWQLNNRGVLYRKRIDNYKEPAL